MNASPKITLDSRLDDDFPMVECPECAGAGTKTFRSPLLNFDLQCGLCRGQRQISELLARQWERMGE